MTFQQRKGETTHFIIEAEGQDRGRQKVSGNGDSQCWTSFNIINCMSIFISSLAATAQCVCVCVCVCTICKRKEVERGDRGHTQIYLTMSAPSTQVHALDRMCSLCITFTSIAKYHEQNRPQILVSFKQPGAPRARQYKY